MFLSAFLTLSCAPLQSPGAPTDRALRGAWRDYRHHLVDAGRVVDPMADAITTSEGQAYGLLRAAWVGDRREFERLLEWTRIHLQGGEGTALPAWKWAPEGGVMDPQPAADADQLMAYALLLAHARWGRDRHRVQALGLLERIWEREVARVGERWVLLPGPWALGDDPLIVNPSYAVTFAWRAFAEVDPDHPWMELLDDTYALLAETLHPNGLPPDWAWIDHRNGQIVSPPENAGERTDFGFEAFRVYWNLAADLTWYGDERARVLLGGLDVLARSWREGAPIPARIDPSGAPAVDYAYTGLHGAILPAWALLWPSEAETFYAETLVPLRTDTGWHDSDDYYTQNWVWFGLALWTGLAQPPEALR